MNKYWFTPKKYGYGFSPISWEGWLMTLVLLGLITLSAYTNDFFTDEVMPQQGVRFILDLGIFCAIFFLIALPKTRGKLKWSWGSKREEKK